MGTARLEDVAEASHGSPLLIFQLYVQRDRNFTASLLQSEHDCKLVTSAHAQQQLKHVELFSVGLHSVLQQIVILHACICLLCHACNPARLFYIGVNFNAF